MVSTAHESRSRLADELRRSVVVLASPVSRRRRLWRASGTLVLWFLGVSVGLFGFVLGAVGFGIVVFFRASCRLAPRRLFWLVALVTAVQGSLLAANGVTQS